MKVRDHGREIPKTVAVSGGFQSLARRTRSSRGLDGNAERLLDETFPPPPPPVDDEGVGKDRYFGDSKKKNEGRVPKSPRPS